MFNSERASETESLRPDSDPREMARRARERADAEHPTQIGPYRILQPLGEGGMGTVYLAEQTKPIHRRVALKIIKLGMDTKSVIARFEAEREALALMNHPNVAKVFDAGATETGRPYFVMERVAGIPITEYCDKHRLNTEERLRLFAEVCHAVQHAHQKGIIHRDIKPNNVLVAVQDDKPVPKVIDFGVAKATQHRLTERTIFTEQGQLIGTPGYMSPEQAEMTALDIDTRTDIYSLGVVLYELLVGSLPFDTKTLLQGGLAAIQRIIREVDPPKPSTRLSSMGEASTAVAHSRRTQTRTLAHQLRGDLDWIVMKCLEKDRTRRYDTANGLALEIGRYLSQEPVLAGPPRAAYRMRKFLRRNRRLAAGVAGVAIACLSATTLTTYSWLSARAAREQAILEAKNADFVAEAARFDLRIAMSGLVEANARLREAQRTLAPSTGERAGVAANPGRANGDTSLQEFLPHNGHVENAGRHATASGHARVRDSLPLVLDALDLWMNATPGVPDEGKSLEAWIAGNQDRFVELRRASAAGWRFELRFKDVTTFIANAEILSMSEVRDSAKLLIIDAWMHFQSGDVSVAAESLEAANRLGSDAGDTGLLINTLVETLVKELLIERANQMMTLLSAADLNPEPMARVALNVRPIQDLSQTILQERLMARQYLTQGFRYQTVGGPPMFARDLLRGRRIAQVDDRTVEMMLQELHGEGLSYDECVLTLDRISDAAASWTPTSGADFGLSQIESSVAPAATSNPLIKSLWPDLRRAYMIFARLAALVDGTRLAADVCKHRYLRGHWPGTLSDLAAISGIASAGAADRDSGFRYRLVDGWPLLYHTAEDGLDNGGCPQGALCGDVPPGSDWIVLAPPGWFSRFAFEGKQRPHATER